MGAEGVSWIGQAPFTNEQHVFQNFGDGTYTHYGLLAIRAAAAAGVNITYKILYNDAVAMTGGQPAEGGLTVSQIAHQVSAEGAKRLVIVSDEPEKYPSNYFPSGATVHHRRELDAVQQELREIKGLTVLIYDQTCAAEKRRRRKRGPIRIRRSASSSTSVSARAAATARLFRIVSRCSRWKPNSAASGGSTSRTATRIFPASRAFARVLSPCMAASCGRPTGRGRSVALFADLPLPRRLRRWRLQILVTGIGAPASSPSARCSAWPPMSRAWRARRSTSPGVAEERRGHEPCPDRAAGG